MEYKFKKGDQVRIKPRMAGKLDRTSIGIENIEELKNSVLTITDATPGGEVWIQKEDNGKPTYTVTGNWRMPEVFLVSSP